MSLLDTAMNETASCVSNMKSSAVVIRGCVTSRILHVYRDPMYQPMWEQLKKYTVFPLSQEAN